MNIRFIIQLWIGFCVIQSISFAASLATTKNTKFCALILSAVSTTELKLQLFEEVDRLWVNNQLNVILDHIDEFQNAEFIPGPLELSNLNTVSFDSLLRILSRLKKVNLIDADGALTIEARKARQEVEGALSIIKIKIDNSDLDTDNFDSNRQIKRQNIFQFIKQHMLSWSAAKPLPETMNEGERTGLTKKMMLKWNESKMLSIQIIRAMLTEKQIQNYVRPDLASEMDINSAAALYLILAFKDADDSEFETDRLALQGIVFVAQKFIQASAKDDKIKMHARNWLNIFFENNLKQTRRQSDYATKYSAEVRNILSQISDEYVISSALWRRGR